MSVRFSETLDRTRRALETQTWLGKLKAVTIVRDVSGKIHLFLEEGLSSEERKAACQVLEAPDALGPYWSGDIWEAKAEPESPSAVLSEIIRAERRRWASESDKPEWYVLERHVAKQSWTEGASRGIEEWPLEMVDRGEAPAVVAFYSFKGGLGRTTTVAAVGLTLARAGYRVALVDLDLEAPGLASMLLPADADHSGVIDYLLEKPILKDAWHVRENLHSITEASLLGDQGQPFRLLPAGEIDQHYLEKLARVDVQNLGGGVLSETLRGLLRDLQAEIPPGFDFILLDARAGFHQLGGLALTELAHASVVLGIHSKQSWAGMELVLRRLARPAEEEGSPVIIVHTLAPPLGQPGREVECDLFVDRSYDTFSNVYYRAGEVPSPSDPDQPHIPVVIPWQPELRGEVSLSSETSESAKVRGLVERLTSGPYRELAERLCSLMGRPLEVS